MDNTKQLKYFVSVGNYEGGLLGLSLEDPNNLKDIKTEYAFSATEGSINAIAGNGKLLALGGFAEIIKLFNLQKKKESGDLFEHRGSITCLQFYKNTFLISGAEEGDVIIWRVSDWVPLHKLKVKNISKVTGISLHPSGRILLVIYENNMLRLWNLLDGRCTFKKKLGLDQEDDRKTLYKVKQIKWEPTKGEIYAILYDKKVDIMSANSDIPVNTVSADSNLASLEFLSESELVITDDQGDFTILKEIMKEDQTTMSIGKTTMERFKDMKCAPDQSFIVTLSTDGKIAFWNPQQLRNLEPGISNIKPQKTVKSKHRLQCLAINYMGDQDDGKNGKEAKLLKKRKKKLSKDEKAILKRQKLNTKTNQK